MSLCLVIAPAAADTAPRQAEPETSSGTTTQALATSKRTMAATASAHATDAALAILRQGGSATDAAIAAQLVLGLVEPQSSGLGGGGFFMHWDAKTRALKTYDGRETAPAAATPDRFLADGKPLDFDAAVHSGLSVGTPGLIRLLAKVHETHGHLPWKDLFAPAIRLAREGFAVTRRLNIMLRWYGPDGFSEKARAYFFDEGGTARPIGHILKNPDYAATLDAIAKGGPDAFYKGAIADAVVEAVAAAPLSRKDLTKDDLARYEVRERAPLCVPYRTYKLCGMGPPSSGGIAVFQVLKLIEPFDIGSSPAAALSTKAVHLILEAEKLAYADRGRFLADPDHTPVPDGLLDDAYLKDRRAMINEESAMAAPEPGSPPGLRDKPAFGHDATLERSGTSHLSIIDAEGNVVSFTTTIEGAFGSGLWAAGFLLNNQLTDFSFLPTDKDGNSIANRVEGGKRPRSSMAPTIVFDAAGEPMAALGSPGGSRIILYVVKALIGILDWKLDAAEAIALPNFGSQGGDAELELTWSSILRAAHLKTYGHGIDPELMNSGLHAVVRRKDGLEGAADPRREGTARGD